MDVPLGAEEGVSLAPCNAAGRQRTSAASQAAASESPAPDEDHLFGFGN
jgi:hypothetical protein